MRLSYVVFASVLSLVASTEGAAIAGNFIPAKTSSDFNPIVEDHRFLRTHETAVTEERGLPTTSRLKEKLFKLQLKIAMPSIKKVLTNVIEGIFK
ncbi:Putative RxLR effector [Phytophthora palmivora]|uniref:RxLR effector protein n=1 Tax=Phytophthora palmivora TaxID=4796 RepID=A0A2P4Y670_9STRA|nr:Putative RxLR effector [Phytophthora palmivora]